MKFLRVGSNRSRFGFGLIILILTVGLLAPAPTPALALSQAGTTTAIAAGLFSTFGAAFIGYGIYENLPSRQGQERLIKGEFYVGGYGGAALAPSQDLSYLSGASLNGGPAATPSFTARNNQFGPAVVGGLKLGYFCNFFPYLGLELETSYNRSPVRMQTLGLSSPIKGFTVGTFPHDNWVNWTVALHIVGRYGFLKDQEVPFGRLQPYVGIGPACVAMYDEVDSAKNFAIDVMAGLRYMMLKNVSAYLEYKFNYQWGPEMEAHYFYLPDSTVVRGIATLDYASHKIVAGVAYHW